jgi:hypothetical protein
MILAKFAEEYDVPHARVHRAVRSLAHAALARRHGGDRSDPDEVSVEPHALDVTLKQGVRVTTSKGSAQFSYEVTDPEMLYDWLRDKYGQDLLDEEEVGRLLDYMEFLLNVVVDEGVRPGGTLELQTEGGKTYGIPWTSIEEMENILWRAGRIENETYVPR